ncbi:cytidylyltransferase domain-containing protein [Streptomyces platensis]|uniref:cytidylyltransferase domain-containing protein n=1 Tax=Streptomyces platensis TaxID=58346 RepID=UPI00386E7370|nr:hypothetical protein OG962_10785 [Streptomyces platensis]
MPGDKPLLWHVHQRCQEATRLDDAIVATDDHRIEETCRKLGIRCMMTGEHATGTDRVAGCAQHLDADAYINVQGDRAFAQRADPARGRRRSCSGHLRGPCPCGHPSGTGTGQLRRPLRRRGNGGWRDSAVPLVMRPPQARTPPCLRRRSRGLHHPRHLPKSNDLSFRPNVSRPAGSGR